MPSQERLPYTLSDSDIFNNSALTPLGHKLQELRLTTRGLLPDKTWGVQKRGRKGIRSKIVTLREEIGIEGLHRYEYRMLEHKFQAAMDNKEAERMSEGSPVKEQFLSSAQQHIQIADRLAGLVPHLKPEAVGNIHAPVSSGVVFEAAHAAGA